MYKNTSSPAILLLEDGTTFMAKALALLVFRGVKSVLIQE